MVTGRRSVLVEVQHPRIERHIQEGAEVTHGGLGVLDQRLVRQLVEGCMAPERFHVPPSPLPAIDAELDRHAVAGRDDTPRHDLALSVALERAHRVPRVADDVDDPRIGKMPQDLVEAMHVARGLVHPDPLARPLQDHGLERVDQLGSTGSGRDEPADIRLRQVEPPG